MQLGKLRTQSVQLEEKLAGKDDEIKNLATTVKKIQAYNLELKDSADKSATSAQQAQTRQLEAEVQRLTAQLAEATATKGAAMNAQLDQAAAVQLSSIESLHRKQRQTAEREFMEQFEKLETQLKTTKTRLRETENEVARTQADKNQLLRTIEQLQNEKSAKTNLEKTGLQYVQFKLEEEFEKPSPIAHDRFQKRVENSSAFSQARPASVSSNAGAGQPEFLGLLIEEDKDNRGFGNHPSAKITSFKIAGLHPQGLAARDGRIRVGDRLLSVDGFTCAGQSREQVTSRIQQLTSGDCPKIPLVVSRYSINDGSYEEDEVVLAPIPAPHVSPATPVGGTSNRSEGWRSSPSTSFHEIFNALLAPAEFVKEDNSRRAARTESVSSEKRFGTSVSDDANFMTPISEARRGSVTSEKISPSLKVSPTLDAFNAIFATPPMMKMTNMTNSIFRQGNSSRRGSMSSEAGAGQAGAGQGVGQGNSSRRGSMSSETGAGQEIGLGLLLGEDNNGAALGHSGVLKVTGLHPQGIAAKNGRIRVGDRILSVDGCMCTGQTRQEVVSLLQRLTREQGTMTILVGRYSEIDGSFVKQEVVLVHSRLSTLV